MKMHGPKTKICSRCYTNSFSRIVYVVDIKNVDGAAL